MNRLLTWLAELTDTPIEPGTELGIQLAGFPAGGRGLLVILGALVAVAVVFLAYRRDADRLSAGRRRLLTALRAVGVLLAVLLLLDPQLVATLRKSQPGQTLVLIDTSQSMGQKESFERPEIAELASSWETVLGASPGNSTRLELVRGLLARDDGALLDGLRQDNRVLVYGIGATAEPLGALALADSSAAGPGAGDANSNDPQAGSGESDPGESGSGPAGDGFDPATLRADGGWTNPGEALRAALGQSGSAEIAGVVLISDGRRNLGPQGPEIARTLRNRGVPTTVVVPIGDPSPVQTLRIERVEAPEKVFQKDPFQISAVLEGDGYEATDVEVRLSRIPAGAAGSGDAEPEFVQARTARIDSEAGPARVDFVDLRSGTEGVVEWIVEIVPPRFEAKAPERHVRTARVEVLGEQTKVLLLAGGPSHEFRILRNLLIRDDTIEVSCWLQSADPDFPQDGNVSLTELPADAEKLGEYDVFVTLDPDPTRLPDGFAELVSERVREHGAGLWWVCGEKHTLNALRENSATGPLAALLPVEFDLESVGTTFGLARGMKWAWPWLLTPAGRVHKATRIAEDRQASASLWPQLPGFYFVFPVERARPAAQILVGHERPIEGSSRTAGERRPILATQFVGAGRVLFTASDDTYRWRQTHEAAYDRFWVKGIRYLFEGRLGAGSELIRVEVDEPRIELGAAQRILVEARTQGFEPREDATLVAVVTGPGSAREELELQPVAGALGSYEAWYRPRSSGEHRVAVRETHSGDATQAAEVLFDVVPAAVERPGPTDLVELGAIASAPGGVLVNRPDQLPAALDQITSASRIESLTTARTLWDSWITVSLITLVLGLEWWLRKRSNLL